MLPTLAGFVLLCAASSAVYLVNDLADVDADRKHPQKRYRPIAAGTLSPSVAITSAAILFFLTLALSLLLSAAFALIVATYIVTNATQKNSGANSGAISNTAAATHYFEKTFDLSSY